MADPFPAPAPPRPSAAVVPVVLGVQAAVLAFVSVACFAAAALPRHPTGKLYKRLLRDRYWEGTGRRI